MAAHMQKTFCCGRVTQPPNRMLWMPRISVTETEAQHHYAHAEATGIVLSKPSTKNRECPYIPKTEQFLKILINNISRHKKIPLQKQTVTDL